MGMKARNTEKGDKRIEKEDTKELVQERMEE